MMVSNSSDFAGASWETYAISKSWTLTSGDGSKTVYIKFKDTAGNTSSTYSDSIILDTTSLTPTPTSVSLPITPTKEPEQVTPLIPTPTLQLPSGMVGEGETPGIQGNTLTLKLTDAKDKPLVGIIVTLTSEAQTGMTNEYGEVTFRKVMPGSHTLSFEYQGQTIERTLNLLNDEQDYKVDIKVETTTPAGYFLGLPWWGWGGGVFLVFLLIFFVLSYFRKPTPKSPLEYQTTQ
ncbi:MAG: carboxypeptidase regulatory-like domain-containing protein [Candidatus Cloacimonetes bacterium]|nr:carboxypeptidase regulatory-like domain-containing protein [Candidatus Cloacimonadota bacterium]